MEVMKRRRLPAIAPPQSADDRSYGCHVIGALDKLTKKLTKPPLWVIGPPNRIHTVCDARSKASRKLAGGRIGLPERSANAWTV